MKLQGMKWAAWLAAWCAGGAGAQSVDLQGRVLEKANMQPVAGAAIKLTGSALQTVSDSAGYFHLKGNTTGLGSPIPSGLAGEPFFREGDLFVAGGDAVHGRVRVEIFDLGGKNLSTAEYALERKGWNRLPILAGIRGEFLGFARISSGGVTYVKRILRLTSPMSYGWAGSPSEARSVPEAGASSRVESGRGESAALKGAAAAGGTLEVTADKLVGKTVGYAADAADLGNIVLDYPPRKLDVGAPPIYGAQVLFDGSHGKAAALAELKRNWQDWPRFTPSDIMFKIAKDPQYPSDTNRVTLMSCCNTLWGYDDIQALSVHGDAQVHAEFVAMGEYDNTENANASDPITDNPRGKGYYNSGVYIQSRYEIQIQAFSLKPTDMPGTHDIGALVDDYAPTSNAIRANGVWQAFDVTFRSARYDAKGVKTEDAYMSVWWNGVLVHDNRQAHAPATGTAPGTHSGEELNATLYGIKLQSEGTDVRFRNVWIKPLTIALPQTNFGY